MTRSATVSNVFIRSARFNMHFQVLSALVVRLSRFAHGVRLGYQPLNVCTETGAPPIRTKVITLHDDAPLKSSLARRVARLSTRSEPPAELSAELLAERLAELLANGTVCDYRHVRVPRNARRHLLSRIGGVHPRFLQSRHP